MQVLNSPAAVSSIQVTSNSLIATGDQSGKAFVTGISQKTYHANKFHCFRGKSVESNEPDKSSIISFITLIQRKCVKTDKLCQVYLNGVRSKGFRPDTFKQQQTEKGINEEKNI